MLAVADRLLELEREVLFLREYILRHDQKLNTFLTPQARELEGVLKELAKWATDGREHKY